MKKFQRLLDLPRDMKIEGHIDDGGVIALANAHSDAIEALETRLADAEHLQRAHTDNHATAHVTDIPPTPLRWVDAMTADEAADIIVAVQDDVLANLKDSTIRGWTRGVVALMVGALREHGREDDAD